MSVGERISALRKEKQLSQYKLAQLMEVSRQAVSKWENDQTSPDTLNLIQLADILDTQVEYLATGNTLPLSPPQTIEKIVEVEKVVEVERIVEKKVIVEKPVYIEKVVEVEKIVDKPKIKRYVRFRYVRNIAEYWIVGLLCFFGGVLAGTLLW